MNPYNTHGTRPPSYACEPDGIQRGNAGIDIGTWETTNREPERPTLPGHEHEINQRHVWEEAA